MTASPYLFRSHRRAFTLIELLVASVLTALLLVISLGAYSALSRSASLTLAGQQLAQIFEEARQDSVAKNLTIELRLYDLPPQPGAPAAYSAVQVYALNTDGTTTAMAPLYSLPAGITMDATAARSPLLASNPLTAAPDATDPRLNSQTRVAHFLPDGATDLPTASKWFVTLRAATASDPARFPANWACVQIDPNTGHITLYRP